MLETSMVKLRQPIIFSSVYSEWVVTYYYTNTSFSQVGPTTLYQHLIILIQVRYIEINSNSTIIIGFMNILLVLWIKSVILVWEVEWVLAFSIRRLILKITQYGLAVLIWLQDFSYRITYCQNIINTLYEQVIYISM